MANGGDRPLKTPIYDLADSYVEQLAELDPVAATSLGIAGHDEEMTDYSPDGFAAMDSLREKTLQGLDAATATGERDRIAREVMEASLGAQRAMYDAGEHLRGLGILGSPVQSIRMTFDQMPRATPEDWERIAVRLGKVGEALASYRATLDMGVAMGRPAARRQAIEVAKQCATWSGRASGRSYFDGLLDAYNEAGIGDDGLRARLEDAARTAAAAYGDFGAYLANELSQAAGPEDAVGSERYQRSSRVYNGTELDLEATYAWGWEELYRIEAEMRTTAERIKPGASVDEVRELLESDPSRCIEGEEAFQRWMQELQDRTITELNGVHFDIPEPIQRIEAMIAPPGGALAMYYTSPSEDFSRPGRTWYPTGGKTRFPLWGEVSIAYHEGVPGHHLERASVRYNAQSLSRFQRLFALSGYVEGWALYAERLMSELGYLEEPDYYLGMLRAQALRCVRVVVDIGMHLQLTIPKSEAFHGGETWTPELGQAFADQRSQFPPEFMASEITRYLGRPGQAISYKVGERAWLEAREATRKAQGEAFNLKRFHARAFDIGPMGLAQMQRELGSMT
jgi:uncharacterized protein (DUF885 family)